MIERNAERQQQPARINSDFDTVGWYVGIHHQSHSDYSLELSENVTAVTWVMVANLQGLCLNPDRS